MKRNGSEASLLVNRILYLVLYGVLASFFLFALHGLLQSYSSAQARALPGGDEKIGPGVREALQTSGKARVVIALVEPKAMNAKSPDLMRLKNEVSAVQESVISAVTSPDFIIAHQYKAVPALTVTLLTQSALDQLATHPNVAKIDLDAGGTGGLGTSVPLVGADTWHNVGNTGEGVVIAVLDSGLDTNHSDFASALIDQACFLDNDGSINGVGLCPNGSDRQTGPGAAEDNAGHGTHVTGIIASRGHQSSGGVAPGASIVAIKVTAGPSFNGVFYYFSEVVAALDYIIVNHPEVRVINMSLVTNASFVGDCDTTTSWNMAGAAAIDTLRARGVVSFASSGNNGSNTNMNSPACLHNVISVGATDNNDSVASFTNSNAALDLLAPGVGIVSSAIGNTTVSASGTSMASPHAAGCAALLIASGEALTPDQIETRLKTSPVQVIKNGLTYPRIDCSFRPLNQVEILGPATGFIGDKLSFTANVGPITVTQPLSYTWQATGQTMITTMGGFSSTALYAWNTPGVKVVSVISENAGSSIEKTTTILIQGRYYYLPLIVK